ncbi:hypothetical protein I2494_17925 [Budviciaceae bacterium BWR-B9]|uniref:DUF5983 domain-containing protein n=1 Tax=Limnobaculum allomyrinae TaxID=2791986 RepID=A0ABS1IVJ1_9GAMM|nr:MULTISPECIES: DUF5983 family protein [Limnobaculum]MBK5145561.1 hypothetical protein [Limnobaculum allomyrinae]MBV7693679.1 hypothetical protein [Limnobaculum sp. M2-1]
METLKTIICSTGHFTLKDNEMLEELARDNNDSGTGNYILSYNYGYMLRLYAIRKPVLDLKSNGISKELRKFIVAMMKFEAVDILIFDSDGDFIEGFETFDW